VTSGRKSPDCPGFLSFATLDGATQNPAR
jgi:hypothetical protein